METSPDAWLDALQHSHDSLRAIVEPLGEHVLQRPSYASEWSIAQVLSHLGSGAEIFGLFLEAGLSGAEPPGQDTFPPIWQAWNERSPQAQAADALVADGALVKRLASLDAGERARMRLQFFGMDLDITGLARMRLGEHAVHSWDIAVALDPAATLAAESVNLLIDTIGMLAARTGKPGSAKVAMQVQTTAPERTFRLTADGDGVALEPAEPAEPGGAAAEAGGAGTGPRLRLPAEALIRLVYGRLDAARTPATEAALVDLDDLRPLFPGF